MLPYSDASLNETCTRSWNNIVSARAEAHRHFRPQQLVQAKPQCAITGGFPTGSVDSRDTGMVFMSLAALIGGFPGDWGRSLRAGFDRANCLGAAAAACCLLCAASSRNPKLGLLGALAAAVMAAALVGTKHQWHALGRPDGHGFPAAAQSAVG